MSYLNSLEDNLSRVKNAKEELASFGDIGASPLLDSARHIGSQLETLQEEIEIEISKEESEED